jgi:hypothetical protein
MVVYSANKRELGTYDTLPATLLPLSLVRGDGFTLDRFSYFVGQGNDLRPYVERSRGHIVSRYPVAPALFVLPVMAAKVAQLDSLAPGWDHNPVQALGVCARIAKWSMSVLMVLAAGILHRFLLRLGLRRGALPATLAAFLGSDLWTHASQALWQHGPATLALIASLALLFPGPASRGRLALAGIATALLFASRLLDSILAAAIVGWIGSTQPRRLGWFVPAPIVGAAILLGYNFWYFGTWMGGQARLEKLHQELHGVSGVWSGNLLEGAAGTLLSPNRGLFVFSPWIAVALVVATVPAVSRRIACHGLVAWLLAALLPYFLLLSKYSVWWGGHCFGARYWTDVIPLFAVVLAFALDWMWTRSRTLVALTYLLIALSIGMHGVGAFCYPSTWNLSPGNVDLHHERLWDWRDTELRRCLIEHGWWGTDRAAP